MPLSFSKKIKGFLFKPTETFSASKDEDLGTAFLYILPLIVISNILIAVIRYLLPSAPLLPFSSLPYSSSYSLSSIPTHVLEDSILGIIYLFIGGLWIHLWAWIFGARKGITKTLSARFYSTTPGYLFGWIPVIGIIISSVWTLVLTALGISEFQEISRRKSVYAVIWSIIPAIIVVVLVVIVRISTP